ncbi:MAG: hypothetical protein AAGC73_08150 [Verrucomicrobiota bacterium]
MKHPRNVSLRLSPMQKAELKALADASGMSFSAYLEAILSDAVQERPLYRPQRVTEEAQQPQATTSAATMR